MFLVYRGQYRYGSTDELIGLATVVGITTAVLLVVALLLPAPRIVPLSVPPVAGAVALVLIVIERWAGKRMRDTHRPTTHRVEIQRAIIVGAGDGGLTAVRIMHGDVHSKYRPVALLDDDLAKRYLRIDGVHVMGRLSDLERVATALNADVVVFAIPTAGKEVLNAAADTAARLKLKFKVLPSFNESALQTSRGSLAGTADVRPIGQFRDVSLFDLIGRHQIKTDVEQISQYLAGKTVLVTGAGGSIGSRLCAEISRFAVKRLVMTDRDESGLHSVELGIGGRALLTSPDLVLGDLRDSGFIPQLFASAQPDVVFHAAALKHLPLLESFPEEAVKTNVLVTDRLLTEARRHRIDRFVHISTDKAAEPTSVLGLTKRIAERLTATTNDDELPGTYLSVRFGNVLGSRGSVLTTFASQVASGGPLTVTDPQMRRYFMTVDEACELVVQAGAIGASREVLVLDMGEQVLIEDLARRMAEMGGHPEMAIEYTGLRHGEKLLEKRLSKYEADSRPSHPQVSQVPVPPFTDNVVERLSYMVRQPMTEDVRRELVKELNIASRIGLDRSRSPR
nr:polysaccharide biosynthesis protein [Spelaeicoccus albus]